MQITRPRGTNDFLTGTVEKWQQVEDEFRRICREYGYTEIRTPIFEHTELFHRGVGETTDIVEKEMYTFLDRGNRSITLRPEITAAIVRAYIENKLGAGLQPTKLYQFGPVFRYDKPQAGRYRQFHQLDAEVLGTQDPAADAEIIMLPWQYFRRLGLEPVQADGTGTFTLHINSIGCPNCRPVHREKLQTFLKDKLSDLCPDCQSRYTRNPLRILDCKNEKCQSVTAGAPDIVNCLCDECAEHFAGVRKYLDAVGVGYILDPRLVRGLDYYTKVTFEFMSNALGAQSSICGGGRYDGLVDIVGGQPTPATGFAIGVERLVLTVDSVGKKLPELYPLTVFIATIGTGVREAAFDLLCRLRGAGITADQDFVGRSLKGQMKYSNKLKARWTVILGEDELARGTATVREMATSEQVEVPLSGLVKYLQERSK